MLIFLIMGIICLALFARELTRTRVATDRQRQMALHSVRAAAGQVLTPEPTSRRSLLLAPVTRVLANVHRKLWRRETDDTITMALLRAGASRRLTPEVFMAGRVAVTLLLFSFGFLIAHSIGRILLGVVFGLAGFLFPKFFLSKAATSRAERINSELPHFVDQLSIALEAGMSFDAALTYLVDASKGPLTEEMKRVLTELRVGESRKTAIRSFAVRVGSDDAMAFANAVLASDQLGSPLGGILRDQASDLRHRRQMNAEERAQKTPVKMLLPMVIFILPVMFVIILAPAVLGSHGLL
jgi:tight adherence protein C